MDKTVIKVTLGPGNGIKEFTSPQEMVEWLNAERKFYCQICSFVSERELNHKVRSRWDEFERNTGSLIATISSHPENAPATQGTRSAIIDTFNNSYGKNTLIYSKSLAGDTINALVANQQIGEAVGFAGYLMRLDAMPATIQGLRGAMLAHGFERGTIDTVEALTTALQQYRSDSERVFAEQKQKQNGLIEDLAKACEDAKSKTADLETEHKQVIDAAKKEWDQLKATYDTKLALEAPVTYWEKKANHHKNLGRYWGGVFLALLSVFVWAGISICHWALDPSIPVPDPSKWHPEYWHVATLVTVGLAAIWILRVVMRMFLSNVHLGTDAKERMTMVETYLALMKSEAKLDEKERAIILTSLFRPATSGVVKDDGAPVTVGEWATKMFVR